MGACASTGKGAAAAKPGQPDAAPSRAADPAEAKDKGAAASQHLRAPGDGLAPPSEDRRPSHADSVNSQGPRLTLGGVEDDEEAAERAARESDGDGDLDRARKQRRRPTAAMAAAAPGRPSAPGSRIAVTVESDTSAGACVGA